MSEGKLSVRQGGRDEHVHRCICGAWSYTGVACATCAIMRGEHDGMDEQRTTD
jgi:hypothetical protein